MAGTTSHVLIPAAGESSRFVAAGYRGPKAALEITLGGVRQRMIDHVVSRLPEGMIPVLVIRPEHQSALCGFDQIILDGPTRGQSETVLKGLRDREPILIHNCDVLIGGLHRMLWHVNSPAIALHKDKSNGPPSFSYVDDPLLPARFREKERISNWAVSGAWWFPNSDLLRMACELQLLHAEPGEECYLSGALDEFIVMRGVHCDFTDLGTPEAIAAAGGVIHQ